MDKKSAGIYPAPSGRGIQIRLWQHGRQVYCETRPGDYHNASDLKGAIERRKELKSRLRLGLPLHDDEISCSQRFVQVAQGYMDSLDTKYSTQLSYEYILNRYWVPAFGHWPCNEITHQLIKNELAGYNISNKTKNNILIPLRGVMDYADIHPNPARGFKFRKQQTQEIERYKPSERDKILAAVESYDAQSHVYFSLLFGCGLRPGEALGLLWSDYDGHELSITKQITRRRRIDSTKTSMRRKVYVPNWVKKVLNNHETRFKGDHIFLNSQGNYYRDTDVFNNIWKKSHAKAQLSYRIPYACRHTRAAELLSIGISPPDAAKQMGHSVEVFLRRYSEWIAEYAGIKDNSRFEKTTLVSQ